MDFGLEIDVHRAQLGGHDVRAKESFPDWGHNSDSDNRSQSYGQITKDASNSPN